MLPLSVFRILYYLVDYDDLGGSHGSHLPYQILQFFSLAKLTEVKQQMSISKSQKCTNNPNKTLTINCILIQRFNCGIAMLEVYFATQMIDAPQEGFFFTHCII
jgi:hypothetical protein